MFSLVSKWSQNKKKHEINGMKTDVNMSEKEINNQEMFEHYNPQYPLPEEINKMERDETVCKYCGVSYLIHNEIKKLEEKLKATEKELEHLKGCEVREIQLKEQVTQLKSEIADLQNIISDKSLMVTTLQESLENESNMTIKLQNHNHELVKNLENTTKVKDDLQQKLKSRNVIFDKQLPLIRKKIQEQKTEVTSVHQFVEERNKKIKEEMMLMFSDLKQICQQRDNEKIKLQEKISSLETEKGEALLTSVAMKEKVKGQEQDLQQLSILVDENNKLQQQLSNIETKTRDLQHQLDEAVSKCRSLTMESQQFKDQLRNKNQDMEDQTAQIRRKEQNSEMTIQKLQNELGKKQAELATNLKDYKNLENRLHEQQRKEEEIHRKATFTVTESRELKDVLNQAKAEIEQLKSEREVMITSHQNRIEQLRQSFQNKLFEADKWPEKLEEALRKEREKHQTALKSLEDRLVENFVMEMQIEKQKYQELLEKYQGSTKNQESMLKSQLNDVENRYKAEIRDLQRLLADNKTRAKETEESLRREIESLKSIIRDLEDRLARLDHGSDEKMADLKIQLKETHEELEEAREELTQKTDLLKTTKNEVKFLQETVQREVEERFELTEALSTARTELLKLKKPPGGYSGGSNPRQSTADSNMSLKSVSTVNNNTATTENMNSARNTSVGDLNSARRTSNDDLNKQNNKNLNRQGTYTSSSKSLNPLKTPPVQSREISTMSSATVSSSHSSVSYVGDAAKPQGKMKGGSIADTRKRIANILGRKS
ncbi:early endosome antigen 1-like isoform X1 [Mytilus trossulus]|uniref:early endosome antigen 1-like isoform X1 n=2 Tax=Mytilus trossulus TaxID=6551 RepID=UPI003004D8E5